LILRGFLREGFEGFAVNAHDSPLVEHVGSHLFVEVDGGLVPVEDVPLEAVTALEGDGGETGEEGLGYASASEFGADEEVFEVDAGVAAPGGVEGEVEGHSCRDAVPLGNQALEDGARAEAVAEEVGFGGDGGFRGALVFGEFADEGEHFGSVGGGGFSDSEHGCWLFVASCWLG
jgi:hypothetical protein